MFAKSTSGSAARTAGSEGSTSVGPMNLTGKLANFSARHRWAVLGAWVAVLAVAFVLAGGIDDVTADTDNSSSELEYVVAQALVSERISGEAPAKEFVVVEFEKGTAENAVNKAFISSLSTDLLALEHVVGVTSYLDGADGLVSSDETTALVMTSLSVTDDESADIIEPLLTVISDADASDGFSVATVGQGSLESEFMALAEETLAKGEMIGVGFALVILLIVFGAAVAAGLPIMLAIVSIIVAVALSAVIGRVMDLDQFVVQIISMIGLAVGIDYALFIVKRYGEELAKGRDKTEAITAAGNTAGRTVLVSGAAVMIALAGMLIVPDVGFRSFGLGAIVVVVAAVSAATTLLPAIISVLGKRVFWLRIPFVGRKIVVQTDQHQADSGKGGIWDKITDLVTARPVISVVVAGGALVAVTGAALTMNLGSSGISSLPEDSASRHAYEVLTADFDDGLITTDIVIDSTDVSSTAVQTALASLEASLAADPFYGVPQITVAPGNDLVLVSTVLQGDALGETAEDALARLREQYIPAAFDGVADVYVAGSTAEVVDNVNMITKWLPIVFGLVLTSSFVLLLIVFRSIVVPIKAVVMNVLSVGAAYGLLVLVFQNGIGIDLLGFQRAEQIEYWLPMFLFSILFGLSMDYHVFLLSRIKEHYDLTGDNKGSVAFGLRSTAGIITGAALIMVGVFGGFALGDMTMFQQMGFGLAAAVIIDATVVRSVLVPASMVLLGDKNWYFPSWLEWLPHIDVDGEQTVESEDRELDQGTTTPLHTPVAVAEVGGD